MQESLDAIKSLAIKKDRPVDGDAEGEAAEEEEPVETDDSTQKHEKSGDDADEPEKADEEAVDSSADAGDTQEQDS